jgi:GT2 family glycosyltransferase
MPPVAVVVCTRNRPERLANLRRALAAQSHQDFELRIVDDSADPPMGPSAARNEGWRATTAPLVAFTDDDCEPAPDWLERLLAAHAESPHAVLQGSTEPLERERHLLDSPRARTQVVRQIGPYYQCCNIAYPRRVLERVGGFAQDWPWGGEDADLAWRAKEAGVPFAWVPEARVEHAVTVPTPAEYLRSAAKFEPAMRLLADHPQMRPLVLEHGLLWKRSHAKALLAAAGLLLARRHRPAAALALPLLASGPLQAAYTVLETASTIRGGIRHRTPVV